MDERYIYSDEGSNNSLESKTQSEEEHLRKLLKQFKGDKQAIANYLGVSRTTLWRKLKAAQLEH